MTLPWPNWSEQEWRDAPVRKTPRRKIHEHGDPSRPGPYPHEGGAAGPSKVVEVYHGTSVDAAREIKAHGIKASKNYDQRGREKSVYFTDSYRKALYYANWKGLSRGPSGYFQGDVAIVEFTIPQDVWDAHVVEDEHEDDSFRLEQDIPPEWITRVSVITDKGALKVLTEQAQSAHRCYKVYRCRAAA